MVRLGKRLVGRGRITDLPVEEDVVRRHVVELWRALLGRVFQRYRDGQRAVVDIHEFGGVLRLGERLGNDHRDHVADEAHLALRQRRPRRLVHRPGRRAESARYPADPVGGEGVTGEHRDNAGGGLGRILVYAIDRRVRVRRADEVSVSLAGPVDVVGIAARAGEKPVVLRTLHRGADACLRHGLTLSSLSPRPERP